MDEKCTVKISLPCSFFFICVVSTLDYSLLVMEMSEGDGTVEVLRITKQGETELTKEITFSGGECATMYTGQIAT